MLLNKLNKHVSRMNNIDLLGYILILYYLVTGINARGQLRSQPTLIWAIAQGMILNWLAYLKMGQNLSAQL